MDLCHVFVFCDRGAPEAAALQRAGWRESFRRSHPGQGTANACYCLDNAYLELLWVEDPAELSGPVAARTGLAGRADWRRTGANPFGLGLRSPLPGSSWAYRPPYLPAGMSIPVAEDSADPHQPFVFRSPGSARPDAWTDGRAGECQRPAGLAEIVGIELEATAPPGDTLLALAAAGLVRLRRGPRPAMLLRLSRRDGGGQASLSLPDFTLL